MTASIVQYAGHGMLGLNSDGSFTYYPYNGYTGTDTFTYQAYANGVASNVATVTLTVVGPPSLANPGYQANNTGEPVSVQLAGNSPEGNPLAYSGTGLPSGLTVDPDTGEIYGSINHSANLSNPVTVTVTDTVTGQTATQSFIWAVTPTSHAPTLDPIDDQANAAGDTVYLAVNGNSVDGSPLTYSATGLPGGTAIEPGTGVITGTIATNAYGLTPYQVTVTVSDGTSSASQSFAWTVGAIQLANPGDQTNAIGDAVSLPLVAHDYFSGTPTFSAVGLPNGLTINQTTGLIGGTVTAGAVWQGDFPVTVTATDGTYSASQDFDWTVTPATDVTPPTIVDPGAQNNTAGDTVSLQILASSAAGGLTYSVDELPDGLTMNSAGLITGTPTSSAIGSISVTVTVIDPLGGTAQDTFTWAVMPAPVSVTVNPLSAAKGIATGPVLVGTFTTTDLSAVASDYAASINWGDNGRDGGTIEGGNGVFTVYAPSASHAYATAGGYTLGLTVTQADGSSPTSATGSATVVDIDGAGPVSIQGFDITVQANGDVMGGQLIATFKDNNLSQGGMGVYTAMLYGSDGSVSIGTVVGASGSYSVSTTARNTTAGSHTVRVVLGITLGQLSINLGGVVVRAKQQNAAVVTKVTVLTDAKSVAAMFKVVLPLFARNLTEFQQKNVGRYDDPKKTGNAAMVNWIVIQGTNLDDLEVQRFVVASMKINGVATTNPVGPKGYVAKKEIVIKGSLPDGPNKGSVWLSASNKFLVIADTPGIVNVGAGSYPASLDANFYLYAKSKADKELKAEVWYDVNVATTGPGVVATNQLTVTKQLPK